MVTIGLIILTVIVSFMAWNRPQLFDDMVFYPYVMRGRPNEMHRFFTAGALHADMNHLIFNMLTLFFFGRYVEQLFGPSRFLIFYFSALAVSALPSYFKNKNNPSYRAVGASGAVSAVMFSLVLLEPWQTIYLQFFIPLYFVLYAVGYLIFSWYMARKQSDNIGHDIHFWGALYGVVFCIAINPEVLPFFLEQISHPPFLR
jgi:membrane associated rhomboid family serine protease